MSAIMKTQGTTMTSGRWMKAARVILALSLPGASWASSGSGSTTAQYLEIGVGAREVAMGGAAVATTDNTHALYWNPAGAAAISMPRLDASYNNLYQGTNQGFIGFGMPVAALGGVVSGGIDYLQVPDIEHRNLDSAAPDYTFSSKDAEFIVSYAKANVMTQGLSLGGSLKYLQSAIDYATGRSFAVDFGAQYRQPSQPWSVGASLLNLGTSMKYVDTSENIPLGIKAGGAYRLLNDKVLLAAGIDSWLHDQRSYGDFGAEYKPAEWTSLRMGYQIGHGQDELGSSLVGFSTGAGFQFHGLNIDYAFVPFGDLGMTQRFSIGFSFGETGGSNLTIQNP